MKRKRNQADKLTDQMIFDNLKALQDYGEMNEDEDAAFGMQKEFKNNLFQASRKTFSLKSVRHISLVIS